MNANKHLNFTVLLIGGGSASGKTELSKLLSNYYQINRLLADDVRISMEAVVEKSSPIYNFEEDEDITVEERTLYPEHDKQMVSAEVCKGLENIVHHHIIIDDPIIIEGDDVLPQFAFARQQHNPKARSIFLYEDSPEQIKRNLLARNRLISDLDISTLTEDLLKRNLEIRDEARSLGLNAVKASPYETLEARVVDLLL